MHIGILVCLNLKSRNPFPDFWSTLKKGKKREYYFSKIDVKDAQILIRIGSVYKAIGHLNGAIEYFQKAKNINPRLPQTYFGLYSAYLEKNDTASAIRILNDWLKLNPRDTSALNILKELREE